MKKLLLLSCGLLTGCFWLFKTVRQEDLDSWKNVSTDYLITHNFFSTLPRTVDTLSNGIQVWNYSNCGNHTHCSGNYNSTINLNCSSSSICCNNMFFIKDNKVIEYRPVGRCYTDNSVRPH